MTEIKLSHVSESNLTTLPRRSQQFPKLLHGQAGVSQYSSHGVGIDWILPRQIHLPYPVTHCNVAALPDYAESCFFPRRPRLSND